MVSTWKLEYASTVGSPHTAKDRYYKILKLYSAGQPAGLPVTTSAPLATQMIKDLNWRTLGQRRVDSRLALMYKITYDLVAIPAADYLIPNTRQSRHNHQLAYRQYPTCKDYYKYTFFPHTIVHWNALPVFITVLPTVAVCQVVHVSPYISEVLLTILTPPLHLYTFLNYSPLLFN